MVSLCLWLGDSQQTGLLVPALGPSKLLVQRLGWNENGTVQMAQCTLLWGVTSGVRCFRAGQPFYKGRLMPSVRWAGSRCSRASLGLDSWGPQLWNNVPEVTWAVGTRTYGSASWLLLGCTIVMDPFLKCFCQYKGNRML